MGVLGVAGNYTTMWYVNDGYDPVTNEWNPRGPLDDRLLPSQEFVDKHMEWLLDSPFGMDYRWIRDLPFGISGVPGMFLPIAFGRLDIFMHLCVVQAVLSLIKTYINFTWQTPPSSGTRLAVYEMDGDEFVQKWRNVARSEGWTRIYWKN